MGGVVVVADVGTGVPLVLDAEVVAESELVPEAEVVDVARDEVPLGVPAGELGDVGLSEGPGSVVGEAGPGVVELGAEVGRELLEEVVAGGRDVEDVVEVVLGAAGGAAGGAMPGVRPAPKARPTAVPGAGFRVAAPVLE